MSSTVTLDIKTYDHLVRFKEAFYTLKHLKRNQIYRAYGVDDRVIVEYTKDGYISELLSEIESLKETMQRREKEILSLRQEIYQVGDIAGTLARHFGQIKELIESLKEKEE